MWRILKGITTNDKTTHKNVLAQLGLTLAMSVIDAGVKKGISDSGVENLGIKLTSSLSDNEELV